MPKVVKPLTAKEVQDAKARDKDYSLFDGGGLYLLVKADNGSGKLRKWWRLKYQMEGKSKLKSIGTFPAVSLAEARKTRDRFKQQLHSGEIKRDEEQKQEAKLLEAQRANEKTFRECAEQRFEKLRGDLSESHIERTLKGFRKDVYPKIGDTAIQTLEAPQIRDIMIAMRDRDATESARKVFYSISKTFKYAVAHGYASRNPCADIDLGEMLGAKSKNHYPIITDNKELGALLKAIDDYKGHYSTVMALKMQAHVFVRPFNIRHAKWDQIDLTDNKWTIPASEMKTKSEHIVPLSDQMVDLLHEVHKFSGDSLYLFPSSRGHNRPMSDAALVNALRRMGYDKDEIVAHSFRGIFSTIAHEKSSFKHEVIEVQLAHSVGNSVSEAYNRAKYLEERTMLMQWWSDYLEGLKAH